MTILVDGWCLFSALYILCLRMVYFCNISSVPIGGNMQDLLRYVMGVGVVGWSRDTWGCRSLGHGKGLELCWRDEHYAGLWGLREERWAP